MRLRTLWTPIFLLALAGCGEGGIKLEKGPYLKVDRDSLGFGLEFRSGTFIGTTGYNSLYIENTGDAPLEISEVTKEGDSAFTLQLPTELTEGKTIVLESLKHTFIEVQFKPREEKLYKGMFTIKSTAGNAALKQIGLSGCGLLPPNETLPRECEETP